MNNKCIKCQNRNGKLLFVWYPALNTIEIVRKDMLYRVRLSNDTVQGSYQIIEQRPKKKIFPTNGQNNH